jgi:hypothetical protein
MHKNATKCNKTLNKWCKNKHGASKIMVTLETYHGGITGGVTRWQFPFTEREGEKSGEKTILTCDTCLAVRERGRCGAGPVLVLTGWAGLVWAPGVAQLGWGTTLSFFFVLFSFLFTSDFCFGF